MVSEWMDNGNVNEYVQKHKEVNRAQLVSSQVAIFLKVTGMIVISSASGWCTRSGLHAQPQNCARRLEGSELAFSTLSAPR